MDSALSPLSGAVTASILSQFDAGLRNRSEEVLSERVAPASAAAGGTATAGGANAGSGAAALVSLSSAASFSFSASFRQLFARSDAGGSGGASDLFGQLDALYKDFLSYDPKQAEMLSLVAQMLMAVDPEAARGMLQQMHDSLGQLAGLQGAGQATLTAGAAQGVAAATPGAASPTSAESPPPPQIVTQTVHFSFDFSMQMTSSVRTAVARLRDNGVEVQTTQTESSESVSLHIEFTAVRQEARRSDPLVVDLGGDGVALTSAAGGTAFDINADGASERTAFVQGNDAFLALDRNGNGRIDDGSELFGDQHGAANGFAELGRFDGNGDGRIDRSDAVFGQLRLLHDKNGDGRVGPDELSTLLEAGIASIDLSYRAGRPQEDGAGNLLAERSAYTRADGSRGMLVDAWVGYQ